MLLLFFTKSTPGSGRKRGSMYTRLAIFLYDSRKCASLIPIKKKNMTLHSKRHHPLMLFSNQLHFSRVKPEFMAQVNLSTRI